MGVDYVFVRRNQSTNIHPTLYREAGYMQGWVAAQEVEVQSTFHYQTLVA